MEHFKLVSKYQPTGDQPQAIEALVKGFQEHFKSLSKYQWMVYD
mgnify:CR=1 FL=1